MFAAFESDLSKLRKPKRENIDWENEKYGHCISCGLWKRVHREMCPSCIDDAFSADMISYYQDEIDYRDKFLLYVAVKYSFVDDDINKVMQFVQRR